MTRVFNFSAGPAVLPEPVLRKAAEEMLDWHGSGMSVMEMSHRGKEFISIHAEAEALLRELLAIPASYKVRSTPPRTSCIDATWKPTPRPARRATSQRSSSRGTQCTWRFAPIAALDAG